MSISDLVAEQYAHYPYPPAGDDIPTWLRTFNYAFYDPCTYSALFWPEGRPKVNLDILVAGCGTMQAAVIAFTNPECSVTGVDFSETSIAHEERLQERHQLKNLTLRVMDLSNVQSFGKSYDLILCTGVLHHLADPGSGLRKLASALDPGHGAMIVMLYGRAGRLGIYLLQDAFRRMRIPQTPAGIQKARSIISRLPPHHPGRRYYEHSPEMGGDAAFVDTFLHRQDRAFSVTELLELVETNGLKFQCWLDGADYNEPMEWLDGSISERDRWCIAENSNTNLPTHHFICCHPERGDNIRIKFTGDDWMEYFPQPHPTTRASPFANGKFSRAGTGGTGAREYALAGAETVLLAKANGKRTIARIIEDRVLANMKLDERKSFARIFYERMWLSGHMHFSKVPVRSAQVVSDHQPAR